MHGGVVLVRHGLGEWPLGGPPFIKDRLQIPGSWWQREEMVWTSS
jgi:hypothetical protein